MTSIDPIKNPNKDLVESLKGKEALGVDNQGRLYKVQKIAKITNFFSKNAPRVETAITEYAFDAIQGKEFRDIKKGSETYRKFQQHLSKIKYVKESDLEAIAFAWHNQRYSDLIQAGSVKEVAEAITVAEMIADPNISEQFKTSVRPSATTGGTSGSYFLKNRNGETIGIFKPRDEEMRMPNNPRGFKAGGDLNARIGPRAGHVRGSSWQKEIGAWVIDKGEFAHVPFTTPISIPFPMTPSSKQLILKEGSFQLFAKGEPIENLTTDDIKQIPNEEIQKIAIFDLMVGNSDRNFGNALYDKATRKITPIDHGLILLDSIDWLTQGGLSETSAYWLELPHVQTPLKDHLKKWVLEYNIENKIQELRNIGIAQESLREHALRMLFLKEGVSQGFSIYELGKLSMQTIECGEDPTWLDSKIRNIQNIYMEENEELPSEDVFYPIFINAMKDELPKMKNG